MKLFIGTGIEETAAGGYTTVDISPENNPAIVADATCPWSGTGRRRSSTPRMCSNTSPGRVRCCACGLGEIATRSAAGE